MMSIPVSEMRRQFGIIARPRRPHAYESQIHDISRELYEHLSQHMTPVDLLYVAPSFIICLKNPDLQRPLLLDSPLHTPNYELDLLPWSREHELAQLPWITDNITDESQIIIDPLTILPTTMKGVQYLGKQVLKGNYVSMLGTNYELRAPDFSYLMITELKDYYHTKHSIFHRSKDLAVRINLLVQQFCSNLLSQTQMISASIQSLQTSSADKRNKYMYDFAAHLQNTTFSTATNLTNISELINMVRHCPNTPINLEGYKEIPPLLKTPVPASYLTRLRIIHATVTKKIYGSEAIVATTETSEGMFEAYITIGDTTCRYNEVPLKTAATIETILIYQSLRYITTVLGYRIVDLNYPVLAALISAINKLNVDIDPLLSYVSNTMEHTQQMHDAFLHLQDEFNTAAHYKEDIPHLHEAMGRLINVVQRQYTDITSLFHEFIELRVQYLCTYLHTESPIITSDRWIPVEKPDSSQGDTMARTSSAETSHNQSST